MTRQERPLGTLSPVQLREYWEHEALHFTPWLADNIDLLGDALGMNLSLEGQEVGVGPFRADILALDVDENAPVLIENQLENTDFPHLGAILTYAAGLDAASIIWVAKNFVEEHRAALDWLNRVTVEGVNFFGVRVELWRIGDSIAAPRFHVVSKPNEWSKRFTSAKKGASVPRAAIFDKYEEFWSGLADYLEAHDYPFSPPKPSARNWVSVKAKLPKGIKVNLSIADSSRSLWIYGLIDAAELPGFFAFVSERNSEMERAVGGSPDLGPRASEGGGDIGWRIDTQSLDHDTHEKEFAWVAETVPKVVSFLIGMWSEYQP